MCSGRDIYDLEKRKETPRGALQLYSMKESGVGKRQIFDNAVARSTR